MNWQLIFTLTMSAINDILIVSGSMILMAMGVEGKIGMPSLAVVLFSLLTGVVQAARRVDSKISPSVVPSTRTPDELLSQISQNKVFMDSIAKAVSNEIVKAPTPPPKPPIIPTKDSS